MLIDLHAHTSAISRCCKVCAADSLKHTKESGMDGIVLTNHYQKNYIGDDGVDAFVNKYIDEFYYTKSLGEKSGLKVFWGIEVTMELYPNVHMLIYGVDTDFLKKQPLLFDMTQKELYALVKANDGVLIQAHPYRNGTTVLDINYLDGVEINCHPKYKKSYAEELIKISDENKILLTCGGDFHADTYRPKCGVYLPDDISDEQQLINYLLSNEYELCIHEPDAEKSENITKKI